MLTVLSILGSLLDLLLSPFRWGWHQLTGAAAERRSFRREANLAAFHELYKIAYRELVAHPPFSPLDTFADAETEALSGYLLATKKLVRGKEEYADQELLERMPGWDEIIYMPNRAELEAESRWFYHHVNHRFNQLRHDLQLT